MKNKPTYSEPLSTTLRRTPLGDKEELAKIIYWVGFTALGIFSALFIQNLLGKNSRQVPGISLGIIPIVISPVLLKRDDVSVPIRSLR